MTTSTTVPCEFIGCNLASCGELDLTGDKGVLSYDLCVAHLALGALVMEASKAGDCDLNLLGLLLAALTDRAHFDTIVDVAYGFTSADVDEALEPVAPEAASS